jgi:hypothetical protein
VHIYPGYSLRDFFYSAKSNLENCLESAAQDTAQIAKVLCLAERSDCNFFAGLAERISQINDLSCKETKENNSLSIGIEQSEILIIAGRQIVTAERLELLALGLSEVIDDGMPFSETLQIVNQLGAIAVLPWSPGKWMFRRKRIVESLLRSTQPSELYLGDTSLRPDLFREPELFELAASLRFSILAGTDPLPLKNEELRTGSYVTCFPNEFDSTKPFQCLKDALASAGSLRWGGERLALGSVLLRLLQLKFSSKSLARD